MSEKKWTQEEVAKLVKLAGEGKQLSEIAAVLDRPYDSVRYKQRQLKAGPLHAEVKEEDDPKRIAFWKRQFSVLEREVTKLRDIHELDQLLIDRIVDIAPASYGCPQVVPLAHERGGTAQSALLMFSDTHIGKEVSREQTLGIAEYNFDTFLRRLFRLECAVTSIMHDHTTTNIEELHVAMIGDMIDGALTHCAEVGQINTKFEQFYSAGHAIAQFLTRLSAIVPIVIHTAVGNHTRWGEQRKMPTKNRYSNLDMFLYAYLEALTAGNDRIKWNLDKQPFAVFNVYGTAFYAGHGDHLKGGDRILGIPNHAIGRQVSATTQTFSMAGRDTPNFYLFGHYHKPIELPHAKGKIIVNGGFPGVDELGTVAQFVASQPQQNFFLVHPKFGRTATYDIQLAFGDDQPHGYQLPERFVCR